MKTYHQEKAAQTVHQARGPMSVDGRGNVSQELTRLYTRARVCEKKGAIPSVPVSPPPVATSLPPLGEPSFPRNPPRGQRGRKGSRRTDVKLSLQCQKEPSRTPAQDYKNPGTRSAGSLPQVSPDAAAVCALFLPDTFLIITTL